MGDFQEKDGEKRCCDKTSIPQMTNVRQFAKEVVEFAIIRGKLYNA